MSDKDDQMSLMESDQAMTKDVPVEIKAVDEETGSFTALAAVFGNKDLVGDRIKRGAFRKTLMRWRKKGDPIPIILSHNWNDPWAHIGVAQPKDVKETAKGLEIKGQLDIFSNDVAAQVHRLMKRRSLTGWSFGYGVVDGKYNDDEDVYDLKELDLFEAGPTLRGANPEAQLQGIKSALEEIDSPEEADEEEETEEEGETAPEEVEAPVVEVEEVEVETTEETTEAEETVDGALRKASQKERLALAMVGVEANPSEPEPEPVEQDTVTLALDTVSVRSDYSEPAGTERSAVDIRRESERLRLELLTEIGGADDAQ